MNPATGEGHGRATTDETKAQRRPSATPTTFNSPPSTSPLTPCPSLLVRGRAPRCLPSLSRLHPRSSVRPLYTPPPSVPCLGVRLPRLLLTDQPPPDLPPDDAPEKKKKNSRPWFSRDQSSFAPSLSSGYQSGSTAGACFFVAVSKAWRERARAVLGTVACGCSDGQAGDGLGSGVCAATVARLRRDAVLASSRLRHLTRRSRGLLIEVGKRTLQRPYLALLGGPSVTSVRLGPRFRVGGTGEPRCLSPLPAAHRHRE